MQQEALALAFMDKTWLNPNVRIGIPNPGKTCQTDKNKGKSVFQLLSSHEDSTACTKPVYESYITGIVSREPMRGEQSTLENTDLTLRREFWRRFQ